MLHDTTILGLIFLVLLRISYYLGCKAHNWKIGLLMVLSYLVTIAVTALLVCHIIVILDKVLWNG